MKYYDMQIWKYGRITNKDDNHPIKEEKYLIFSLKDCTLDHRSILQIANPKFLVAWN